MVRFLQMGFVLMKARGRCDVMLLRVFGQVFAWVFWDFCCGWVFAGFVLLFLCLLYFCVILYTSCMLKALMFSIKFI